MKANLNDRRASSEIARAAAPLPPDTNPFSTRFVRPGAMAYFFSDDVSLERIVARLRDNNGWGQILGPHGTGKSTLLQAITPQLAAAGKQIELFTLHQGQPRLDVEPRRIRNWNERTQIIVDGYEQLSWWHRWRLVRECRKRRAGLLVTTHRDLGLPTLFETRGSLETTQLIASRLLGDETHLISSQDVAAAFHQNRSNVRETLFALYDLYEVRRRGKDGSTGKV